MAGDRGLYNGSHPKATKPATVSLLGDLIMKSSESTRIRVCRWTIASILAVAPMTAICEVPQQITYQGYLTDTAGIPINGDITLVFSFYDAATEGTLLWLEEQNVLVINGLYNVLMGWDPVDNPFPGNLFNGERWIGVSVGGDAEMVPRQMLASTPFAMKAGDADTLNGYAASDFLIMEGETTRGNMTIAGDVSIERGLAVDGNTSLQTLTIGEQPATNLTHGQLATIQDVQNNLTVIGPTVLHGNTSVSGYLDVQGLMNVGGHTTFMNQITGVSANIPVIEGITISGSLISGDTIKATSASINRITSTVLFEQDIAVKTKAQIHTVLSYLVDADKVDTYLVDADKVDADVIVATEKHFRVPNPSDPQTEIWYASVEGPEVAAYVRGTERLVAGKATISLPKHYTDIVDPNSMTVHLTPNSAESLGLATVEKSPNGILVRELASGTGTYEFDYYIVAIRCGYEDYKVIRPIAKDR